MCRLCLVQLKISTMMIVLFLVEKSYSYIIYCDKETPIHIVILCHNHAYFLLSIGQYLWFLSDGNFLHFLLALQREYVHKKIKKKICASLKLSHNYFLCISCNCFGSIICYIQSLLWIFTTTKFIILLLAKLSLMLHSAVNECSRWYPAQVGGEENWFMRFKNFNF